MVEEQKLTKKQLKAAAFKAARKVKDSGVTKAEEVTPAVEAEEKPKERKAVKAEQASEPKQEGEKPVKRNKKRKAADGEDKVEQEVIKEKKPKKSKAAAKDEAPAKKTTFGEDGEIAAEEEVAAPEAEEAKPHKESKQILFVGNMSFTTTQDEIAKHFGHTCGETPTVRLLTKKADPKALASMPKSKQKSIAKGKAQDPSAPQSKGCAFVEFKSPAALRKALAFHHTLFTGRAINVELTAGGGGKGENRQQKIKKKNEDLEEERKKKHEKVIAPANVAHKVQQAQKAAKGGGLPKKKVKSDGQGEAQWGRRAGKSSSSSDSRPKRGMPKFMASGPNSVRLAQ